MRYFLIKSRVYDRCLGTIEILNTRFSATNNLGENSMEQIRAKFKLIPNEKLLPKDLIFSLDWLEKLVTCR